MNTQILRKAKWFWPWQDEDEQVWLGKMSQEGWHLASVHPLSTYTFLGGEPREYTYRLDYMLADEAGLAEYRQIFADAGWEYVTELSNWRYWRKLVAEGETPEIFTDNESKLKKYQRVLAVMAFFLVFLTFMGVNLLRNWRWAFDSPLTVASAVCLVGLLLYAVIVPVYAVVVAKLLRKIHNLKKLL